MNALVPFAPIPAPTNPARLPSLPAWLQQRNAALRTEVQSDSSGRYREMLVLPEAMMLSSSERAEVQRHIVELGRFNTLDQFIAIRDATMTNEQALGVMIAGLLLKTGQKLDQATSDALTEDYLDALEDVPAWAVREALRRWNRAESVQLDRSRPHDFNWAPKPPVLRRLAQHELSNLRAKIQLLQRLLEAVPLVEYSEEHRQRMIERLYMELAGHNAGSPVGGPLKKL